MEQTVNAYYGAILRRDPTEAESESWQSFLGEAPDLESALAAFATSLCEQAEDVRSVLRLYQAVFDRMSDSGGLTFWTNIFRHVQETRPDLGYRSALVETIGSWLDSDEYIFRFGGNLSNNDFLSLLYLNILGRPSDQQGHDFWLAILDSGGLTRQQLIVEFTESDEFRNQVDFEADALLKAAAAMDSAVSEDDLDYDFPGGHPYTGELTNEAPVDIRPMSLADVDEYTQAGAVVAQLRAVDPDGAEDFRWTLIDDAGGAFRIADQDAQEPAIVVANPAGLQNGSISVRVRVTDRAGNSFENMIELTVDKSGELIPFTSAVYEILEGTGGDDLFTAIAGLGPDALETEVTRTANAGDIADGGAGYDRFELVKESNEIADGGLLIDGVSLHNVESVGLKNLDGGLYEPLIFDAALSPDLDRVVFDGSVASAGIWNLQADFWATGPSGAVDAGPVVDIFDTSSDIVWIDSDARSKLAGGDADNLLFNLDNVVIEELRITEDAGQTGVPRSEQVGTIAVHAFGIRSVIGGIVNGWPGGKLLPGETDFIERHFQPTTHTLNLDVGDLTGDRPISENWTSIDEYDLGAIDLSVGQVTAVGAGLPGLESVNITGGGDVFLSFASTVNDHDSDANGFPLEILDGVGSGIFLFKQGGFAASRIDAGGGIDLLGLFAEDLDGSGHISNVEIIMISNTIGAPGQPQVDLGAVQDTLAEVTFDDGVSGDLRVVSIPNAPIGGDAGTRFVFDQRGSVNCDLPFDFDLFLAAEVTDARLHAVFHVDPNGALLPRVDNLNTRNIQTLHLEVVDCQATTAGLFDITYLASQNFALKTLLLSDNGAAGTTRVLNDEARHDFNTATGSFEEVNPNARNNSTSIILDEIDGRGGVRNQEFLSFSAAQEAELKFLPLMEDWFPDVGSNRPVANGRYSYSPNIDDALVVSDDGVTADLGDGDDMITGNRVSATGSQNRLGADLIRGNGGNDLIFGAFGNDQIEGGSGFDELRGESGDDRIWGDEGDDLILAGHGGDYADGGTGNDIVFGGAGNDILRGGAGFDAVSGDDGDDSLFGGGDSDLLIGGRGDDIVDAGHEGNDYLVGDYGSEARTITLTIPPDMRSWDEFNVEVDWDGNGDIDFVATIIAEPYQNTADIAAELSRQLNIELAQQSEAVRPCFDISAVGSDLVIRKMDDLTPVIDFHGLESRVPSVHKSQLGGSVGNGDTFTWDVSWSSGSGTYGYEFEASNPGDNLRVVLSTDGFVDTLEERRALAADIVADFELHRPFELAYGVFWMQLDTQGNICLNGPGGSSGETPTITVSAADGAAFDIEPQLQVSRIDFGSGSGFLDIGDIVSIDIDNSSPDADLEVFGFMTAADMAARASEVINSNGSTGSVVFATVDPDDVTSVILTARETGPATYSVSVEVEDDTIDDEIAFINILDFVDGGSTSLEIQPREIGVPKSSYTIVFDTDLETSLYSFINTYASSIFTEHDLVVEVRNGQLAFTQANAPFSGSGTPAGGVLGADFEVSGIAETTYYQETTHIPGQTPIITLQTPGVEAVQDLTQSLTVVSQEPGFPQTAVDYEEFVSAATDAGQDVFIASARQNSIPAFGIDGYDNDRLTAGDAFGLMTAAGIGGSQDGPDEGLAGVIYVLDFNQGGGDDRLNTFDVNEAFDKQANTLVGGRFWDALTDAFGADSDRRQGDKLAFRKADGALDGCGTVDNYTEVENVSATRDEADAAALGAFASDTDLRYFVDARTFEDALRNNHGLDWGADITQAIVNDAIADLADDDQANNSAAGLANGVWGNAADLLGGTDATNGNNVTFGILDRAKGETWLRVYTNQADTDAAPDAVMELVGLDSASQISFEDIVGDDCIDDNDVTFEPVDLWM